MDQVLDAVVEQLNIIKDLPYDEGGFLDEVDLAEDIWFDDPRILADDQYPFMFAQPIDERKVDETTKDITRELTIHVVLLVDPRAYYDPTEVTETSASREMIRTVKSIRRHFERTSLRKPGGLSEDTVGLEVGTTQYPQQQRGDLYVRSAQLTLLVRKKYLRLP